MFCTKIYLFLHPSEPCDSISIQMPSFCCTAKSWPSEPCDSISIQMVIIYTQGDIVRCLLALVRTVQVPISICHYWQDADSSQKMELNFTFNMSYFLYNILIYENFLQKYFLYSSNLFF